MKKFILLGALLAVMAFSAKSQVRDISITAAPTAEYTWWDNATILNDGALVGGRVGFGFGQFFEIRGVYMKSMDLKSSLKDLNWKPADNLAKDLEDSNVDITRWGGEMKANVGFGGWLAPYLTLGTGVQTFEFKQNNQDKGRYKEDQIYVSGGLGAKINLSNRLVLALEGKNTIFNMNPGNPFLNKDPKTAGTKDNRLYNWSALASLEFYLGGKDPRELTSLDRAYRNQFTGGLKSFKFIIEPGGQYVDFDKDAYFRDAYFLGGAVGFDLSKFVGIRGFYYQATNIDKFENLRLDKFNKHLAMYGGNIIARLNHPTGVVPYITIGGGYLDVDDDYIDSKGTKLAESTGFATGGVGLEIPLSKYVLAYGSANYMLSTSKGIKEDKITQPSDLNKSVAYKAGLRIQLGASANPDEILNRRISNIRTENDQQIEKVRNEYDRKIEELNKELNKAYEENDVEKAVSILEERDRTEEALHEVEEYDVNAEKAATLKSHKKVRYEEEDTYMIKMTPEEFEKLIKKVMKEVDEQQDAKQSDNERIEELEKALIDMNTNNVDSNNQSVQFANSKILEELKALNRKVDKNTDLITRSATTQSEQQPAAIIVTPNSDEPARTVVTEKNDEGEVVVSEAKSDKKLTYRGASVFTGPSFGDAFNWNLGARSYFDFGVKNLQFMPEAYIGLGDGFGFGISGNAVYTFNYSVSQILNPYAGFGVGFFNHDKFRFGTNIILGTSLKVLDGRLFVDYSIRNLFKNNQLAVGYRFSF